MITYGKPGACADSPRDSEGKIVLLMEKTQTTTPSGLGSEKACIDAVAPAMTSCPSYGKRIGALEPC